LKKDTDDRSPRCSIHAFKLDKENVTSIDSVFENINFDFHILEQDVIRSMIIYQYTQTDLLHGHLDEANMDIIKNIYDALMRNIEGYRESIMNLKDITSYEQLQSVLTKQNRLANASKELHAIIGELLAYKLTNTLLNRFNRINSNLEESKENEEIKVESDQDDIISLETVSVLAEDKKVFVETESKTLQKIAKTKIGTNLEKKALELLQLFDPRFDINNVGEYSLDLSSNRQTTNLMKMMKGKKLPNIKSILFR